MRLDEIPVASGEGLFLEKAETFLFVGKVGIRFRVSVIGIEGFGCRFRD